MDKARKRIGIGEARAALADILNEVAYSKRRVVLVRRGKDVAALVPLEDLEKIEADKPISAKERARRLASLRSVQRKWSRLLKGPSLADELIAERREEQRREDAK